MREKQEKDEQFASEICALQWIPKQNCFNAHILDPETKKLTTIPRVNPKWVQWFFTKKYVDYLIHNPGQFFAVPLGTAKDSIPPDYLATDVPVHYRQGEKNYCLVYGIASALQYLGMPGIDENLISRAQEISDMPMNGGLKKVIEILDESFPELGRPQIFNMTNSRRKRKVVMRWEELVETPTPFLTIAVPVGSDGCRNHAVVIIDNIIFDSTAKKALVLCKESLDWCVDCELTTVGAVIQYNGYLKSSFLHGRKTLVHEFGKSNIHLS